MRLIRQGKWATRNPKIERRASVVQKRSRRTIVMRKYDIRPQRRDDGYYDGIISLCMIYTLRNGD